MSLDKRSVEIVNTLISNPRLKSKDLERKFGLSRRQVDYSVKKINEWLSATNVPVINRNNNGNFIISRQVITHLGSNTGHENMDIDQYIPTGKERAVFIILYLLAKKQDISLLHLTDVIEVSKNTVLNDLKIVSELLKKYQLKVHYSRVYGYELQGEERQIRKLIIEIVSSILDMYKGKEYMSTFSGINKEEAEEKISELERKLEIQYTDQSFEALSYVILLNIRRMKQGHMLTKLSNLYDKKLRTTNEYHAAAAIIADLGVNHEQEIIWMTLQMLTSNVRNVNYNMIEEKDLIESLQEMIQLFEFRTFTQIRDKDQMIRRILMHLRPAIFRVKYNIHIENLIYDEIIKIDEKYRVLYEMISDIVYPLEQLIGEEFPDSEIVLISLYFGAELMQRGVSLDEKTRVIVVCANGLSISEILKSTLSELFPRFVFLSLSVRQYADYHGEFDLVFTTVPITSSKPVFVVNPLIDSKEQKRLKRQVYKELGLVKEELSIKGLIDVIKKHAAIKDEKALHESLNDFLDQESVKKSPDILRDSTLPDLKEYLPANSIQFMEEVLDWKEAIRVACVPLLSNQIVIQQFVDAIIEDNDTDAVYSFLGDNIAIPHAKSERGILADGFSMLILEKPVEFRNGKKIKVITPLAINDQSIHLKAISQLAKLAGDIAVMEKITAQDNADKVLSIIDAYFTA